MIWLDTLIPLSRKWHAQNTIALLLLPFLAFSQTTFTRQDSLRGSITPERAWWDLTFYYLSVAVNPTDSTISGSNEIQYTVLSPGNKLQLDLQEPLKLESAVQDNKQLEFEREGNVYYIQMHKPQQTGKSEILTVTYSGTPRVAKRAPWDGGFSWHQDAAGNPFIATSCQGLGASVWWPVKDHMYDEPDSMAISVTVPKNLMDVSNGQLRSVTENKDTKTYNWFVANPINNYGVNLNIGNYTHFADIFNGESGPLQLDYFVLPEDLEKAKNQFQQVKPMLEAFEHWFGPYPFYEDGFKLVQVPYLGMEHQSSVTYGNRFENGYLGRDLSGTGWGLKWDFIIIHESGHEWFANNITYKDIADMWIHESFTAYSENLYLDYYFGTEASADYVIGTRKNILNDRPIIGPYEVNRSGSGDMYYKGANMLHTLRQLVEDDDKWRAILRGLNRDFYHQTVTTAQIEQYLSTSTGKNLNTFFDQYLRTTQIPTLEYRSNESQLEYRYTNIVSGFDMPVKITLGDNTQWIFPNASWKVLSNPSNNTMVLDRNFYVNLKSIPTP
ncbi:MAG: hypothetical protein RLZZ241_1984 [Bacteroidota bacterium]